MKERLSRWGVLVLLLSSLVGSGCVEQATTAPPLAPTGQQAAETPPPAVVDHEVVALALPALLAGKAVVLEASDPDYARGDLAAAVKAAGEGGLQRGLVVRVSVDVAVWRMWNGPQKKDERGNTNRLGQWWSYDAPHGPQEGYRRDYEICGSWNELTWVARCTLKAGAVVAIGPGNSVSAQVCGDASGKEAYPANPRDWQVWVAKAWSRAKELECPLETSDYEADPVEISRPRGTAGVKAAP